MPAIAKSKSSSQGFIVVIFCNIYPGKLMIFPKNILFDFHPSYNVSYVREIIKREIINLAKNKYIKPKLKSIV